MIRHSMLCLRAILSISGIEREKPVPIDQEIIPYLDKAVELRNIIAPHINNKTIDFTTDKAHIQNTLIQYEAFKIMKKQKVPSDIPNTIFKKTMYQSLFDAAQTGSYKETHSWDAHPEASASLVHDVTGLAFIPKSNNLFASCSNNKLIKIWKIPSPQQELTETDFLAQFSHSVHLSCIAVHSEGKIMAYGSDCVFDSEGIHLWNIESQQKCGSLGKYEPTQSLSFIPGDSNLLLAARISQILSIWDTRQAKKIIHDMLIYKGLYAITQNGKYLATVNYPGGISLWDFNCLKKPFAKSKCYPATITAMVFSPDHHLIVADDKQDLHIYTIKLEKILTLHALKKIHTLAIANTTLSAWGPQGIELFNLTTGNSFYINPMPYRSAAFSPNHPLLAVGNSFGKISIFQPSFKADQELEKITCEEALFANLLEIEK